MALTKVGKEGITGVSNSSDATAITIGSSEDIGIGVSPESDHYSPYVNINFGLTGLLGSAASGTNTTFLTNNAYLDTSANWIYKETDEASKYNQVSGTHVWEYAASGSAGGTISFSEAMRIDNSGNVLIGKTATGTAAGVQLEPTGTANIARSGDLCLVLDRLTNAGEIVSIRQGTTAVGGIDANSSSVDFNTSSDYRLKENVTTSWDATTRLKQLKPVRFSWKVDSKSEADTDGFLAHEVSSVVPEATSGEKDAVDADGNPKHQGIDHSKLVALLVKTVQELEARITALEGA